MQKPRYNFYPTLLDAFKYYQGSEAEGARQSLLNKINRIPELDPDALYRMGKGTALNNLIDCMLTGKATTCTTQTIIWEGYEFKSEVVMELYNRLPGALTQQFTAAEIETDLGMVRLYGYMDYIQAEKVIDLKTTKAYTLGKYRDSVQRHLYPFCLAHNGCRMEAFEFLVTDGTDVFSESYTCDLRESEMELREVCDGMIRFIEAERENITDTKVFGLDTPSIFTAQHDKEVGAMIVE